MRYITTHIHMDQQAFLMGVTRLCSPWIMKHAFGPDTLILMLQDSRMTWILAFWVWDMSLYNCLIAYMHVSLKSTPCTFCLVRRIVT